jgi:hypothetical protein
MILLVVVIVVVVIANVCLRSRGIPGLTRPVDRDRLSTRRAIRAERARRRR